MGQLKWLLIYFDETTQRFSPIRGQRAESFKPYEVKWKGWSCNITVNANLKCVSTEIRSGILFETSLFIKNDGRVKFKRSKGGISYEELEYRIKKWPVTGILALSDGSMEERRAQFKII